MESCDVRRYALLVATMSGEQKFGQSLHIYDAESVCVLRRRGILKGGAQLIRVDVFLWARTFLYVHVLPACVHQ